MASQILPQALHMIPRTPIQSSFSSKKLGFSSFASHTTPLASRCLVSRVSQLRIGSTFGLSIGAKAGRELVVRAESNSEGEAVTSESNLEIAAEGDVDVEEGEVISEEVKSPWKARAKLGDIMGILNKRAVDAAEKERPVPDLRTGDIVQIKLEVPENKRRLSIYKGIVMSRQNAGIHTTIRIRRIIAGVGVEIVFPIYSPNIKEILVVKHRKVRRARLYYLRDKLPRLSTFK